jgi:aminoglycoside phosphotransferase (APT) family kinase protein
MSVGAGDRAAHASASPDPSDRAVRARRIDWRFVLADVTPGRVAWFGPADDAVTAALAEAGWQPDDAADRRPGTADLAVVTVATPDVLAAAVRAVGPGGSVYVRIDPPHRRLDRSRRGRSLAPASVRRRLATAGLTGIRVHAHVPHETRRSAIVPLDESAALRLFLVHRGGLIAGRPALAVAEGLRRSGWLARLAPAVSVVGRRPAGPSDGGPDRDRDAISTHLAAALPATDVPRAAPLLLTPSFRASRHVVALVPAADGRRVASVAKVSRVADSGVVTEREAAVLRALEGADPMVRDTAPVCLSVSRPWGLPTLVESGMAGVPLDPATVRRDPGGALDLVLPWLGALVPSSADCPPAGERLERLLLRPLDAFAAAAGVSPEETRRIERTRAIADTLRDVPLPVAIEHGDVSHPNLLIRPDGRLAAVDWELGEPNGLPAHDLFGFLGYVAIARARAAGADAPGLAVRAALLGDDGWTWPAAERYARAIDLDPARLPALAVLSWARRTVGLIERLFDGPPTTLDPQLQAWIREHRVTAAWAAAVERHDRDERGEP